MNSLTSQYLEMRKSLEEICPDWKCRNSIVNNEASGTRVWKEWATVHEFGVIDETNEWRRFESDNGERNDRSRVGGGLNMSYDNWGVISTITGTTNARLIEINNRVNLCSKDKAKIKGWSMIKELGKTIHVPKSVQSEAMEIYSKVENCEELKGKKTVLKVASALMIASRISRTPKGLKVILKEAELKQKELSRCYRLIKRKVFPNLDSNLKTSSWVSEIASKLNLDDKLESKWKLVVKYFKENDLLEGRSPFTVAGVAVFMIAKLYVSRKISTTQISDVAGICHSTITSVYRTISNLKIF